MARMTDHSRHALLQVLLSCHKMAPVRELFAEQYSTEMLNDLVQEARDACLEPVELKEHEPVSHKPQTSRKTSGRSDLRILLACYAKRSISGIQLYETLMEEPRETLVLHITESVGWQPPRRQRNAPGLDASSAR